MRRHRHRSTAPARPTRARWAALALLVVVTTAGCVVPPPPPPPPKVEFVDAQYGASLWCQDADAAQPFTGTGSCNAVTSVDEAGWYTMIHQADDEWTAGDRTQARATVAAVGHRPLATDIYRPVGASGPRPVVVFLHAGAMIKGTKDYALTTDPVYTGFGSEMAARGFVVVAIDYELSTLTNLFTIVDALDGDAPGEPSLCARVDDPHPGAPDTYTPEDCYRDVITTIGAGCGGDCTPYIPAIRVISRGLVDAALSTETTIHFIQDNAGALGVDPTRIFVAGEAAGSVISAIVTHQMWRTSTSPEAQATRVRAGVGAVGYELQDPDTYSVLANSFADPRLPDLGLPAWNDSGAVESTDPPFRAFMSEADVIYGTATPLAALSTARHAGADDGIYWSCGSRHDVEAADRPRMFAQIGRFFRSVMGLSSDDGQPSAYATLPSGPAREWALDTTRQPVVGDFDGNGLDDIYFYGQGAVCDSLWMATPDPADPAGPAVYTPAALSQVQRGGTYTAEARDVNGDGRTDIVFHSGDPADEPIWYNPP